MRDKALFLCCSFLLFTAVLFHGQIPGKALFPPKPPAPAIATPEAVPTATPVAPIPLPQIADTAEQLDGHLWRLETTLAPFEQAAPSAADENRDAEQIGKRARQTDEILNGIPNIVELQREDRYWHSLAQQHGSRLKSLADQAVEIEKQIQWLDEASARWQATAAQVGSTAGLRVVAERIDRELREIQKVRAEAQDQLNAIVSLQNDISDQDRKISAVVVKLNQEHETLRGHLLVRDSKPLWVRRALRGSDQSIGAMIYASAGRSFSGIPEFVRLHGVRLLGGVLIYIVVLVAAFRCRRWVNNPQNAAPDEEARTLFSRPWSTALLLSLLLAIGIVNVAPTGVSFVVSLLYLIPVLRLLPPLIPREVHSFVYVVSAFYVVEWAHLVLQFGADYRRELFAAKMISACACFAWLSRPSRMKAIWSDGWHQRLLLLGIRAGVIALAVSFIANLLGFVSLSQLLGVGTLFSGFTVALLYTFVRVVESAVRVFLGTRWMSFLPVARAAAVERWVARILVLGCSLVWLKIYLDLFTVRDSVVLAVRAALEYPLGFGKVHVTLGGTLSLVFALLIGYGIANVARFMLEEITLPKLSLQGGLAYAISRVTYYILLLGLFFAALTNAGVELNKFTVISGALGLGVGFGLQNIVNNFASGIIILFEHPIRVGDIVDLGNGVSGTVKRIGARSSTVLTAQSSEVIVPNSNLVSNQVTNWTLTSQRRRVEVQVGVGYGTDPEKALQLLLNVAGANPRVLSEPRPEAFFLGFGESSLKLELQFWATQELWFGLKSEVGLAVFRALTEAGIEIPFPQRDLHLRTGDGAIRVEGVSNSGAPDREQPQEPPARKLGMAG